MHLIGNLALFSRYLNGQSQVQGKTNGAEISTGLLYALKGIYKEWEVRLQETAYRLGGSKVMVREGIGPLLEKGENRATSCSMQVEHASEPILCR